jgi:hypothetical protein
MNPKLGDILGHLDTIYSHFEALEQEYHALSNSFANGVYS